MKDSTVIVVFGLGCQTVIAVVALFKGVDTTIIMGASATISGIVGAVAGFVYGSGKKEEAKQ